MIRLTHVLDFDAIVAHDNVVSIIVNYCIIWAKRTCLCQLHNMGGAMMY